MSAPDVNIERQKKRHRTMLWGIWIGLGVVVLVAVGAVTASMLEDETASLLQSVMHRAS